MNENEQVSSVLVLLLAVGAVAASIEFSGCVSNDVPPPSASPVHAMVTLDFGNGTIQELNVSTTNNTAYGFLLQACNASNANLTVKISIDARYGTFVDSIGGLETAQINGTYWYWSFWIDGVYGTTSSDRAIMAEGAHLEWKYGP
jgi:hypothetical protein